jgi:diazepam-binding inhibitor (GABA receptor modulating acyl-CoA-binding protein)
MSDILHENFLKSVGSVINLSSKPDEDELLILYGLYKQALCGNCNIECPEFYKLKERKKYNAWNELKDLDMEVAKKKYVREVKLLIMKYGLND